ncbi:MAG TPA: TonB-dependent receptor [Gemmatimonadaceae bacterium]|jgi:iron complex outermembrane receptor protein
MSSESFAVRSSAALTVLALSLLSPLSLAAQSSGTISGRVLDTQGAPLQGAAISLAGTTRGAIVRSDGSYRLTAPVGRYEIRARLLGYTPHSDSVTVSAGGAVTKSFTLDRAATSLEAVSVIGTRGEERTVIDAPVPIDVLSSLEVRSTGRTETSQMIQALAPSFNVPRTTLGDATDNVRPATLRGLSPDQALVLVNGKRRHVSAVVNINGFVGRGSEAVDLNAIPAGMIDHIEILRDGAAAQYGSDAIAGVINIVLKSTAPGDITGQVGEYSTEEPQVANFTSPTYKHDGKLFYANADHGWTFGQNGYVFLGGEIRDRGYTNRAAPDTRIQYFQNQQPNNPDLPVPGGVDFKIGDSYQHDDLGWLNAGTTLANGIQLYAFGGLSHNFGDAFGFWRRPRDANNFRAIYPNGFLPEEQPVIWDGSGFVGMKGQALGWDYDLSTGYGRDVFDMHIVNSVNVSLGSASPTSFYAGQLAFGQSTTNLDVFRDFKPGFAPLHAAWGLELRDDQYKVGAGQLESYEIGTVHIIDSTGAQTTAPAAAGSQVYPGYQPQDAGNHSRTNVAGYVDLSSDLTSKLLIDLAGRAEHYSDFGSTTTGKIAGRYEPIHGVAFRGAVSSGFRAPSLGQEYFSNTAINFVGNPAVPVEIRTFPVSSPVAQILHAKPLRPEKSMNYSAGVALEPLRSLSLTVDYYRIDLKDRIALSNNFTSTAVIDTLSAHGVTDVQGARYFTNAVDSRTNGLDVIGSYGWSLTRTALLRLTAAYNGNWTRVTRVDSSAILPGQGNALFSRVDQARLEKGNPRNNVVLSANLGVGRFGIDLRNQRFGEVTSFGTTPAGDQTWSPKWVTDASVSYGPVTHATITLGSDNIFNAYPDATITPNTNSGILPYSGISPFGINGRFVYAKLAYGW